MLKQEAATAVFLSVTVIETFVNVFFRVVVSEPQFNSSESKVLHDLSNNAPLKSKLEQWPYIVFGSGLSNVIAKEFEDLRVLRNELTHFQSTHQTLDIDAYTGINGLSDISAFDSLDAKRALFALRTAENIVGDIFRLRGIDKERLSSAMHAWTGKLGV